MVQVDRVKNVIALSDGLYDQVHVPRVEKEPQGLPRPDKKSTPLSGLMGL